jgi:NADP-dependent 3-hydroxy acid dehydrogenase YdfG
MDASQDGIARWRGKVALVTGANSGIGAAIARELAKAGLKVALAARDPERLAKVEGEIRTAGGTCAPFPVDLRNSDGIPALFEAVRKRWSSVDVLINNAGLGYSGPQATGQPAQWREVLEVNVLALAVCTQEAVKAMEGKSDAAIVNISSLAGHRVVGNRGSDFYAASKFAVRALTDGLRFELVSKGSPIKLSMISPGMVDTDFDARSKRGQTRAKQAFELLRPEDIADVVRYLLSTPRRVQIHDVLIRPVGQMH